MHKLTAKVSKIKKFWLLPLTFLCLSTSNSTAIAQTSLSACQAPEAGEYLVLVVNQTTETEAKLKGTLPSDTKTTTCKYSEDQVIRISGWKSFEDANSWVNYINDHLGLSAFITQKSEGKTTPKPLTYNPQSLETGYAVLVDYFHKPEMANRLKKLLNKDVGLVSYRQHPYLLAIYTTNYTEAKDIFEQLNNQDFWTVIVDSRRVILLKAKV